MNAARAIADLSGKELESLRAYKQAIQSKSVDAERLAKEFNDLHNNRITVYAHFRALGSE